MAKPAERRDGAALATAAQGALRGAVAAMAMTGMREFTRHAGLLEEPPPETIVRRLRSRPFARVRSGRRRAQVEVLHWSYGALAGASFAALPRALLRSRCAGPLFGLAVWAGFELLIAPRLGWARERHRRLRDRAAVVADHLLYGYVLAHTRGGPADDEP